MAAYRAPVFCYSRSWQQFLRFTSSIRQNAASSCGRQVNRQLIGHIAPRVAFGLSLPIIPSVHAFWGKKADPEPPIEMSPHEILIEKADALHAENAFVELYTLLKTHREDPVADVQWRVARAAFEMSKIVEKPEEKKVFVYEAFGCAKKSLELDANNFGANKWYGILLDSVGELEGTKQRIKNAFLIKEHFMRAMELKPTDATSVYLLGQWCFMFADMAWYTRKIAAVVFASPPTSTYAEALQYFEKAESIEPNFYSKNLLMLGKTYLRMGNKQSAKEYLTRAYEYPVKTEDDKAAHKEAEQLLKSV